MAERRVPLTAAQLDLAGRLHMLLGGLGLLFTGVAALTGASPGLCTLSAVCALVCLVLGAVEWLRGGSRG
jgi:hypothetical protein